MKVIKTRKNLRQKKNKLTKRKLIGGGRGITYGEIEPFLYDRIDNTIDFLEGDNNKLSANAYDIKDKTRIKSKFKHFGTIDVDSSNEMPYNMYYLDYHGSYIDFKERVCPPNVYICMFGFFDTYSFIVNAEEGGVSTIYDFYKDMTKDKFELIRKYKALLSSPEIDSKFLLRNNELYIDCFTKASWIFPYQTYYDVSMSNDKNGENPLLTSYMSELNGVNIKNTKIKNTDDTTLQTLISTIVNDTKNYIFFIDTCMANKIKTNINIAKIPETLYINQSINYAICKKTQSLSKDMINNINSKTKFLCGSSITLYKYLTNVYASERRSILITATNLQATKKNDNLHPLIPKLVHLYNKLITLNPINIEIIKDYFKNKPNMLIFLISLSFNKLRKFLRKISSNNPELYSVLIEFLKESEHLNNVFTNYNTIFNNFIEEYAEYVENRPNIFSNIKIYKYIYDFLELSTIFNPQTGIDITKNINKTPLSTIFSLNNFNRENIKTNSKKIYISGIKFPTPIILYNPSNNPFKEITHIYANKCPDSGAIFQLKYFTKNKLEEMNIDDTTFHFKSNFQGFIIYTLQQIIELFNTTATDKILRIKDLFVLDNNTNNINFVNFKIVDLHFKDIYNYNNNIEFKDKIELIKLSNIYIKSLKIHEVKTLEFAEYTEIPILTIVKLKKLILNRTDALYKTILNDELTNDVFNRLQELTLKNIKIDKELQIGNKFAGIIKLEIIDSTLTNFFVLNNINELTIINSVIKDNNEKIYKIRNNTGINIKIKDCKIFSFNIFIDLNISNSTIIIEKYNTNIKTNYTLPGEGGGGCFSRGNKKYYNLSYKDTLKLLNKKKKRNGNIIEIKNN